MSLELKDSACQCLYSLKKVEKWSIQLYIEFLFVVTNMESLSGQFEPHNTIVTNTDLYIKPNGR